MHSLYRQTKRLLQDSLYRNSLYIMTSTFIMAGFGFFFWIVNAHLFTTEQIGIATTLLAVTNLISSFSLLGFNNAIIRYLPTSENKNRLLSTSIILISITGIIVSILFVIGTPYFSPKLQFLKQNLFLTSMFLAIMLVFILDTFSESIFVAFRASKFILIKNSFYSICKLILPFLLIPFGAFGIFLAIGLPTGIIIIFSLTILIIFFSFRFSFSIDTNAIKQMFVFSSANYVSSFLSTLPALILPLFITNLIDPKISAYYYIDMTIANLLYIIPQATTRSLFAEGSYNQTELKIHMKKAITMITLFLVPGILGVLLLGNFVLRIFGQAYASHGAFFLDLLAISSIFIAVNYLEGTLLNLKHKSPYLILLNGINMISILGLSYVLRGQELTGIGIAWLVSQALVSCLYFVVYKVVLSH